METTNTLSEKLVKLSELATAILFLFSFNLQAQQMLVEDNSGVKAVTLQSAGNIFLKIPSSSPQSNFTIGNNSGSQFSGGLRDLNWVLKFSEPGKVFKDVSFADPQVGYISTELGGVYKTTDGGDNWASVLDLGFPYYWYGIDALSRDTVVISGFNDAAPFYQGVMRWTFDGGSSWSSDINLSIPVSGVGWLERVHFFNQDTGIVFNSFSGGCWYTTNGGKDSTSWTYISINSDYGWTAGNIDAQSSGQVYATGIHFVSSTDFGADWVSANSADSVFDGGIDFLDDDNLFGWTGGGQISAPVAGWVHRTTDGGSTWSSRLNTFLYPIRALRFFSETTGLAVGGNLYDQAGGIYRTTDGGLSWNLGENTGAEMFSIESKVLQNDSIDLWCVGTTGSFTGVLYKAEAGDLATGIHSNSSVTPEEFALNQNYPNPFGIVTQIDYRIPVTSHVSLKVFDVLGNEVASLVNETESPGNKSVVFNANSLTSGMYYYRLQANDYSEMKKLLVR